MDRARRLQVVRPYHLLDEDGERRQQLWRREDVHRSLETSRLSSASATAAIYAKPASMSPVQNAAVAFSCLSPCVIPRGSEFLPSNNAMNVTIAYQPPPWLAHIPLSPPWALTVFLSFFWLLFRVFKVWQKPASEIDELLGHDIPPQPEVALANIASNSVTLYWKAPENYHTPTTHLIAVNGVKYLQVDAVDSAVTIGGLVPGNHYNIRAISTNNAGYIAYSRLIQVQTIPLDGHRAAKLLSTTEPALIKRPSTGGRRVSAPFNEAERERSKSIDPIVEADTKGEESLPKLNQKLDGLRIEQEDLEQQLRQDTEETEQMRVTLCDERDGLKTRLDERERSHNNSKKQLLELEKQSKAAQRKKSAKERDLQKKKSERQKMKEEIAQWKSERDSLRTQTDKFRRDLAIEAERQIAREAEAKRAIEDVQKVGKALDDDIKEWGTRVKELEEEKRLENERQEDEEAEADRIEREEEARFTQMINNLEQGYVEMQRLNSVIEPELKAARQRARNESMRYPQGTANDFSTGYPLPRSARGSISQGMTGNVPYSPVNTAAAPPVHSSRMGYSSLFPSGLTQLQFNSIPDSQGVHALDAEALTGGAMSSPSASKLIPSGLFDYDADQTLRAHAREPTSIVNDLFREPRRDPQSPASQNSGARNFLPSPSDDRASLHSGPMSANSDIGRVMNDLNDAATKRSIFGSWKTSRPSKEPPGLETLTQGESQSFGLDDAGEGASSKGHQRNVSTLTNPFTDNDTRGSFEDLAQGQTSPPAARRTGLFSRRAPTQKEPFYNLDRQSSPRPTSTYSYDAQLLRSGEPGSLNPFANSSGLDVLRQRSSPLGQDWSSMNEQSFSGLPSRRPSLQYGSTGNLSIGSSVLPKDGRPPAPVAPIGSGRPGKGKAKKLNPAAQAFVYNMFSRGESKKTPKIEKNPPSDAGSSRRSMDFEPGFSPDDSPSASRMSRDGFSVMTSTTDSHDSIGGDSHQGSDMAGSTPSTSTPRENFLARITRKSSSSKFWNSKDRKEKGHNRRKSTDVPSTPGDMDEEGGDYLGQSMNSAYSSTYGSTAGTPIESKFEDRLDEGGGKGKEKEKVKNAARGSLSSSWSKMIGSKKKKESTTAMSETSEGRDEDE